ncbi:hypothetical protein AB1Y20_012160 [Prymnesium parvum]|uniref:Peptidyl-prolyl cis-trans isomerase n=1 Tax=Prymnesium parvum TaxID=97485 RepID=A0AB34IQE6_PRYPA
MAAGPLVLLSLARLAALPPTLAAPTLPPGISASFTACSLASPHPRRLSRRSLCAAAVSSALASRFASRADADAAVARITERVQLEVAVGTAEPRPLVIGLYGDAAPASAALFRQLCFASIPSAPGVGYTGSVASRIERGRAISIGRPPAGEAQYLERSIDQTGYVRTTLVNRADAFPNSDENSLSHDRPGVVSMRRGGRDFEFVITPAANPSLDAERVVVGQVLDGLELVAEIDAVPARRPSKENEVGAAVFALGGYDESRYLSVAKAAGGPRARVEQAYRPLKKVKITSCGAPPRK